CRAQPWKSATSTCTSPTARNKRHKKWFDPLILISRTERSMNWDPNVYRYKWSNGSKKALENTATYASALP
ncbi:DUF825 domain-containing protein, partial [Mycobacterium tuberculosis]|nr:DUF825 domain-containing protein [Mycobacterium tuberculosis]